MLKKIGAIATAVAAVLALASCSKSADPVNATANGNTGDTTQAPGTTAPPATQAPGTTRPRSGTTQATHGTTTTTSGFELSSDEETCVDNVLAQFPDTQDALNNDTGLTAEQAGVVGGAIAGCVPKPELADALINGLKSGPKGNGLSDDELKCLRDQIISLDTNDLGTFVGIIVYAGDQGDSSIAAPIISKLNTACSTSIPA
jgi:hypothetical protein